MSTSTAFIDAGQQHAHTHAQNRFAVIPTRRRLGANAQYTGKSVTIAILDSGFYPHPDLARPENRIIAFKDVTNSNTLLKADAVPQAWDWHGTQTSVVAAGNGYLSDGIYRGLASEAKLVLVKVSERGRITDENIVRGLEWVIQNRRVYNIRVVSMSLGGDEDGSFRESVVDQAAEAAVQAGLVVIVAAGNTGCGASPRPIPPANSPSVITVGGYDDGNQLDNSELDLYCSNFGPTVDGLVKPEIIAPAIWVAAPILPGTDFYRRAEALSQLAAAPDYLLRDLAGQWGQTAGLPESIHQAGVAEVRATVESLIIESKVISTHYQHVDGTSFAAPVVASVVAQMLEANPQLTPRVIKNILISTAGRLAHQPLVRQGYGALNAQRAVEEAAREHHTNHDGALTPPRVENNRLVFCFHHDAAQSVALAGDFNDWNPAQSILTKRQNGIWRIEIEALPPGSYQYKFVVNNHQWVDDPNNGLKLSDGHGGFNSALHIEEQAI
ncbi:MAG: S8 family serine peptidase [Acidobacteria bacterium]|nr:S8 family serine peptidase [Acidobacteriota bacterium]